MQRSTFAASATSAFAVFRQFLHRMHRKLKFGLDSPAVAGKMARLSRGYVAPTHSNLLRVSKIIPR